MDGLHWTPTHRGNLNGVPDKDVIADWYGRRKTRILKMITISKEVPYLEDLPPNVILMARNHPVSEGLFDEGVAWAADYAERAYDDMLFLADETVEPYEERAVRYWEAFDAAQADAVLAGDAEPTRDASRVPAGGSTGRFGPHTPESLGRNHGAVVLTMARWCQDRGLPPDRFIGTGLNEPNVWTEGESPERTTRYWVALLNFVHENWQRWGLRSCPGVCVFDFGVGWPGNGGVADALPDWLPYEPAIKVMQPQDCIGLHEYWALNGPGENWGWWAGRFTKCPYKVPIIITENGIDLGVVAAWYGGWRDLPGGSEEEKAARYADEIEWYKAKCREDARIAAITVFTYDIGSSHWEKFDIRNAPLLKALNERAGAVKPQPPPVVNPPPVNPPAYQIVGRIVSRAPNLGLTYFKILALQPDGMPWSNKLVHFYWRGNKDVAGTVKTGADGYASVEFPDRPTGSYDFELVDPVRGLTSPRLEVDVNREQVELLFQLQVKTDTAVLLHDWAWLLAKQKQVISPNNDAALEKAATRDGFVKTLSPEWKATYGDVPLVLQLFRHITARTERVYYCVDGQWDAVLYEEYEPGDYDD